MDPPFSPLRDWKILFTSGLFKKTSHSTDTMKMKSLKAVGEEFLERTEILILNCQGRGQTPGSDQDFSKIVSEYDNATQSISLQLDRRLRNAAEHLNRETLRLSVTSPQHPHFKQVDSNQRFAKQLFEEEIARLVERN